MEFRISDTFTTSLARLTGDEQNTVKTTDFDHQMNRAHPGMQFHRLDKAKDKRFWSVRVGSDIRLIMTPAGMLTRLAALLEKGGKPPFDFSVVDESQDILPAHYGTWLPWGQSARKSELEEFYETERHLLHVACTRARGQPLVTCGGEISEFLTDIGN